MARSARSANLETRTQRLKLAMRWKPYTARIAPGVRLAYRRNATAGRWSVIAADGKGGNWLKAFADADDYETANGDTVLDFWQAQDRARLLARGDYSEAMGGDSKQPATVALALADYEADLKIRGGDINSVGGVRKHLPPALLQKPVALLDRKELNRWRNALTKKLAIGTVNRIGNTLKAALNFAADNDKRIAARPWKYGFKRLSGGDPPNNIILSTETIRRIVAESYAISQEFGALIEVLAITGTRPSQAARLTVENLKDDRADPRVMMPVSRKGRGEKKVTHRPVPIPADLAGRLRHGANARGGGGLLLVKPSGEAWAKSDHSRLFRRAAQRAGCDPAVVTVYALRHSNIVRQLLKNVPVRVVAVSHDTSIVMIERTYSAHIGDHTDNLVRPALLDLSEPPAGDNVIPIGKKP